MITSSLHGYDTYYDGENWRYKDNNKIANKEFKRPCAKCGESANESGHDNCIGNLGKVINACCGHGDKGYIQFEDGTIIRGCFEVERLKQIKNKGDIKMINQTELKEVLAKVNVKLFDDEGKLRSMLDVLGEVSNVWDSLNKDYQDKIYEAFGIKSEVKTYAINTNFNLVDKPVTYRGTGIEYLESSLTCDKDDQLIEDIRNAKDLRKYL